MSVINETTMNSRLTNTTNTTKPVTNKQIKPYILVVEDINEGLAQQQYLIKPSQNDGLSEQSDEEQNTSTYYENKESDESGYIWSHKRSSERDTQATEYFLQIRGEEKYKQLFTDKKISKHKLWMSIAKEMNKAGYYVGDGREGAERCRQKFSNLEKSFLKYVQHVRSDTRVKRQPPPFYEFMVNIVDPDDRLYKFEQLDAVEVLTTPNTSSNSKQEDKQKMQHNEIVTLLKKQHTEMMNVQREFLDKIDKHLTTQNEQRERMINSFVNAMKSNCNNECCDDNTKKRKLNSMDNTQTAENI